MKSDKDRERSADMPQRREFLLNTLKSLGLATAGGLVWGGFIEESKSAPLILRPPGALPEENFLASCVRCGMCVEACPYDSLGLSEPGDENPLGTPHFIPRSVPCYMCSDIPCATSCPSGALDRSLVSDRDEQGETRLNINLARMGLAVLDRETCIAFSGIQCDACYRSCPLIDSAIAVEYTRNRRTGKHAMLAPVVHSDACTGCGLCEHACVTRKASIFVLPRKIATGAASTRYIKGWDKRDEERLKEVQDELTTRTPRSSLDPLEYLNRDDFQR